MPQAGLRKAGTTALPHPSIPHMGTAPPSVALGRVFPPQVLGMPCPEIWVLGPPLGVPWPWP